MANAGKGGKASGLPASSSEQKPQHEGLGGDFIAQDHPDPGQPPSHVEKNGRQFSASTGLPVVRWKAGELPEIVDQAETALIESNVQMFQRDRMVVRVMKRGVPSIRNYKREPGVLGIVPVDTVHMVETMTRTAYWEKFDARTTAWRRINAPEQVASTYLARAGHWNLPRLWDVVSSPTLRPDGTILQDPGYDEATHVYYDPCGIKFPVIPDKPDHAQARDAFALLKEAFGTFPYEDEVDRAVALSLVLTSCVRRSLPSAPLGAIGAPLASSGKTLLADVIAILPTGAPAPAMTFAETDEEAKKTALAVLMEGDPVVLIDNVERPLAGDWLCSILTSEIYKQRMLGRTEMISVPTRTLMLATGNHIQVAGDMRSRTLLCRIDSKVERPYEREYDYDLRERILGRRAELVAAALTLMRAFIVSGVTAHDMCKQWGRFERWSEMVRAPLLWMDCEDPCESLKTIEKSDPTRGEHLRMIALWHQAFGMDKMTARQAIDRLTGVNAQSPQCEQDLVQLLKEVAADKSGQVSSKRLGRWLERRKRAPVGGYQIEQDGEENHSAVWKVTKIQAPKPS